MGREFAIEECQYFVTGGGFGIESRNDDRVPQVLSEGDGGGGLGNVGEVVHYLVACGDLFFLRAGVQIGCVEAQCAVLMEGGGRMMMVD